MKNKDIWLVIVGLLIGFFIEAIIFSSINNQSKTQDNNYDCYSDKMKICDNLCKNKNLLKVAYYENENNSIDETRQKSYDYTCDCLAQPMKLCQSDDDCVANVGYCDITGTRVCLALKK